MRGIIILPMPKERIQRHCRAVISRSEMLYRNICIFVKGRLKNRSVSGGRKQRFCTPIRRTKSDFSINQSLL